jgi:DNA-binding NarL/FixJ family response regulator
MENRLRVAIVGGKRSQRESLARRMEAGNDCQVVVSVPAGRRAVALVRVAQPDLVLVWLDSPMVEALDVVQHIVEICPKAGVWLTGDMPTETYTPLAQRWGAQGYLDWEDLATLPPSLRLS